MFENIPNTVAQGLARLITQYANATNLQNLLTGIITPQQDIEDALGDMNTLRYLPAATGAQLDTIGAIVGVTRTPGQSDASYLIAIYSQIKINTSQGQPEQLIQLFILLTQTAPVYYFEFYPGHFMFETTYAPPDQGTADMIIDSLEEAAPAGVACDGIITIPTGPVFRYAGILPSGGYGSLSDPSGGGGYGGLVQHS